MKEAALDVIVCPSCKNELALSVGASESAEIVEGSLTCIECDAGYPITKGVPRFVPKDAYAESFGYQWNWFRTVQLDSINETSESEEALQGATGWKDVEYKGRRLLDAGVGAGRFADRASAKGAEVFGVDLTMAVDAAYRNIGTRPNVHLFQADIFSLPFRDNTFDLAYSIGVLHHTPDPAAAFAKIVPLARPGGMIVLGLYNSTARLPLRLRRLVAKATGYRWIPFDPVLRDRQHEPDRRRAWLRDQYQHPEEHRHTIGEVQRWFAENGVDYVRTYPSAVLGADDDCGLFERAPDNWRVEGWLAQMSWALTLGHEGGLFVTIGRRAIAAEPRVTVERHSAGTG